MTEKLPSLWSRRRLIEQSAWFAADLALTGCLCTTRRLSTGTLIAPGIEPAALPLTIDVHCHIFNGTDLQVAEFIGRVYYPNPIALAAATLLQGVVWTLAPDGEEEISELRSLRPTSEWSGKAFDFESSRKKSYLQTRQAVIAAHKSIRSSALHAAGIGAKAELSEQIQPLISQHQQDIVSIFEQSQDLTSFRTNVKAKQTPGSGGTGANLETPQDLSNFEADTVRTAAQIAAACQFIAQYFRLRYVCAQDYLETFAPDAHRSVDLLLPSLVDYDWWLAKGARTRTILPTQVEVMTEISIVSGGQVHAFAPFCPLREIAFRSGHLPPGASGPNDPNHFSSLDLVKNAVQNAGFVGVKLYPPMGFAAWGNAAIERKNPSFWQPLDLDWLMRDIQMNGNPSALSFGDCLDQVLLELYIWCANNSVPILSHTNETNGISDDFKNLAGPSHWEPLFKMPELANLHVDFAHIGDFGEISTSPTPSPLAQGFLDLMSRYAYTFGDAAYSDEVLQDPSLLSKRVESVRGTRDFYSSYLYGTDWSLLMLAGDNEPYFENFVELFSNIDKCVASEQCGKHTTTLAPSERFFGWNAVEYIGLRATDKARQRLEAFYRSYGMAKPEWAKKVDERSS
jgi:hypothetical protein